MDKKQILKKLKEDEHYYGTFGKQYLSNSDISTLLMSELAFQHTGLAVVLQGLVRPRLRGTELEFWRNSEEARTDRPSQQLRSLNGEWRLMRYFLLTHLCGISHRIWCTLSTICSDAA
jgi:hypothetical protein